MKFCHQCGAQLKDEQMFCGNCGTKCLTPVESAKQPKTIFEDREDNVYANDLNHTQFNGNQIQKKSSNSVKKMPIIIGIVGIVVLVLAFVGYLAENSGKSSNSNNTGSPVMSSGEKSSAADKTKKEIKFSKGTIVGNTYKSEFLNLKITPPEGWVFRTESEVVELFGKDYAEQAEMSLVNVETNENVHVITEPLPGKNLTLEQTKEVLKKNFASENMVFDKEQKNVMIAGQSYDVLEFTVTQGTAKVKTCLYIRIQGDRLVQIMTQFLSGNDANVQPVLNAFTTYQ